MFADPIELVIGLFVVAVGIAFAARRIGVAYPILLVLGGLVLGFVPRVPTITLEPDIVFLLLLPPILFGAGYATPIRDFRANARPIALLAVGLVLFTTAIVGLVTHALIPEVPLAAAFTLGAIVAPPDAVAATAIFRRLGVPRRILTILEGESLVNDATAIIVYKVAAGVALGGAFSLAGAGVSFVYVALGGVAIGLVVGIILTEAWSRTADPILEIMLSLLAPFVAYLPAQKLGVSGVLAAVVAGLIAGRRAARALSPDARLLGRGVWDIVTFIINAFAFTLIGLQLPSIVSGLASRKCLRADRSRRGRLRSPSPSSPASCGSSGDETGRGAQPQHPRPRSVPATRSRVHRVVGRHARSRLAGGGSLSRWSSTFRQRDLLIFLTFCVIIATLVGQGLTLPWLVRRLGVASLDGRGGRGGAGTPCRSRCRPRPSPRTSRAPIPTICR